MGKCEARVDGTTWAQRKIRRVGKCILTSMPMDVKIVEKYEGDRKYRKANNTRLSRGV